MNDWAEIRRRVLAGGVSRRQILRETGMHWKTLRKILEHSEPPGYQQQKPRPRKKLGAFLEGIRQILKDDQAMPRKQRHTAKRIWERLQEDGFTGGYTVVKDTVRELTQKNQEVFVPLQHLPGEAQVDFGHALANVNDPVARTTGDADLAAAAQTTGAADLIIRLLSPALSSFGEEREKNICVTLPPG